MDFCENTGMAQYRLTLVLSFFFKFFSTVRLMHANIAQIGLHLHDDKLVANNKSNPKTEQFLDHFEEDTAFTSTQIYQLPNGSSSSDSIGRPLQHS